MGALATSKRAGTVTALVPADTGTGLPPYVTVAVGGDTDNPQDLPYLESYGPVAGDNVDLLSTSGGDLLVIGRSAPDPWHTVGTVGEPGFSTNWGAVSGTRLPGFRRIGDWVWLCGATANSTGLSGQQTMFVLPLGYRPDALCRFGRSATQSAANAIALQVLVTSLGQVQIANYAGTITWGSVPLEGIGFPLVGAT